jgi:hypothetical protein
MCAGEVTVALFAGVETHTDPALVVPGFKGGSGAGSGNGATPVNGPVLSANVTEGHEFGVGEGGELVSVDLLPQSTSGNAVSAVNTRMNIK